ncbi:MAG: exosortase system-associated protein, TIGR04073 family [Verrucomicrobiales bacterium]
MKKLLLLSVVVGIATAAVADIQAPPGSHYDAFRKLGRGLSNILYGWTEIPASYDRVVYHTSDSSQAFLYGTVVAGTVRTVNRFGWGLFEVATFPIRTHKGSYRPPYPSTYFHPYRGYTEFPPEVGFLSATDYSRATPY